jgi:hypothetical protein
MSGGASGAADYSTTNVAHTPNASSDAPTY